MSIYGKRGFLRLACTGQDGLSSSGCCTLEKLRAQNCSVCTSGHPCNPRLTWRPGRSLVFSTHWKDKEVEPDVRMSEDNGCSSNSSRCTDHQEAKANRHTLLFTSDFLSPAYQLGGTTYSEGRRACPISSKSFLEAPSQTYRGMS